MLGCTQGKLPTQVPRWAFDQHNAIVHGPLLHGSPADLKDRIFVFDACPDGIPRHTVHHRQAHLLQRGGAQQEDAVQGATQPDFQGRATQAAAQRCGEREAVEGGSCRGRIGVSVNGNAFFCMLTSSTAKACDA